MHRSQEIIPVISDLLHDDFLGASFSSQKPWLMQRKGKRSNYSSNLLGIPALQVYFAK